MIIYSFNIVNESEIFCLEQVAAQQKVNSGSILHALEGLR